MILNEALEKDRISLALVDFHVDHFTIQDRETILERLIEYERKWNEMKSFCVNANETKEEPNIKCANIGHVDL